MGWKQTSISDRRKFDERDILTAGRETAGVSEGLGISHEGLKVALRIKEHYRDKTPICVPGEDDRILIPEHLLNRSLDLQDLDDPLALAMLATRDPESSMAIAAAARFGPVANKTPLVSELFGIVGQTSRHPLVRRAVELVTENAFDPHAIAHVQRHASRFVLRTRSQYTAALRQNLSALIEGVIAPREFVHEFFELTEAGNVRHDIRKKLVLSLLVSPTIRPSIKFLVLENFHRLPHPVRLAIISGVLQAEPTRHTDVIKEELHWIVTHERPAAGVH
ncbi:hypothetical protein [Shumkonia mesophila]|uniref:hypothetical protein n=1 Tax=Shumkonia mesophila TaxID=2838854 RepID=UPI0029348812|nr:hypothetical protein [Shumkonia mesophila]